MKNRAIAAPCTVSCTASFTSWLTASFFSKTAIAWLWAAAIGALSLTSNAGHAQTPDGEPQLNLPRASLGVGMHRIDAQLATTNEQRQTGLMHRKSMPTHEGMLFVFDQPTVQCFWMRNTLIPLSIAFVQDNGVVVNTLEMKPLDETTRSCSTKPVRFVLEMNKDWFAKRGIKAGSALTGAPFKTR